MVPIREGVEALRQGHLRGWSYSWFGGFPRFYFYFPLPSILVAALSMVLGLGRAAMLGVLVGPLLLPLAAASLVTASGGTRRGAILVAAGSAVFLLSRSLGLDGGTLESAIVGEFSYGIAMPLALFYLASLPELLRGRRLTRFALSAVLLALTALSHVLVTAVAIVASLALLRRRRDLMTAAATWVFAFLLTAWWSVPFLWFAGEMGDLAWKPLSPAQLSAALIEGIPLGVLGVLAFTWRSPALGERFYHLAAVFAVLALVPLLVPHTPFYSGRLLPFGMWAASALAAVAAWQCLQALAARRHLVRTGIGLLALAAALVVAVLRPPPRGLAEANFGGMRAAVDYRDWLSLQQRVQRLPAGAVAEASLFERDAARPRFISDGGLLQLERLTGHRTVGGTWRESSPRGSYEFRARGHLRADTSSMTTGFPARSPDRGLGVRQARLLGARFLFVSGSTTALDTISWPSTREIARDSTWRLFEIADAAIARTLRRFTPTPADSFALAAARWFEDGGRSALPVRIDAAEAPTTGGLPEPARIDESAITMSPEEILIPGAVPGQPLLVRLSFFPNWKLATPGRGPYRAAPNDMLIIPRSETIRLVWRPGWPERAGLAASVGSALVLLLLLGTALARRRRRPPSPSSSPLRPHATLAAGSPRHAVEDPEELCL